LIIEKEIVEIARKWILADTILEAFALVLVCLLRHDIYVAEEELYLENPDLLSEDFY